MNCYNGSQEYSSSSVWILLPSGECFMVSHNFWYYTLMFIIQIYMCVFSQWMMLKEESKVDARTFQSSYIAIFSLILHSSLHRTNTTISLFCRWQGWHSRGLKFESEKTRNLSIFNMSFKEIFAHVILFLVQNLSVF